jgi:hypothetical protein
VKKIDFEMRNYEITIRADVRLKCLINKVCKLKHLKDKFLKIFRSNEI